jgi:hypothetical protein
MSVNSWGQGSLRFSKKPRKRTRLWGRESKLFELGFSTVY